MEVFTIIEINALVPIGIFIAVMFAIGYYHRSHRSSEGYFMANRKVGATGILASTFTVVGAGEIVTLTAFVYFFGFYGISLFIGLSTGLFVVALLSKRILANKENYKPYTISDYMRHYLGRKSEVITLIISQVAVGSLLIIQLVVGGLLVASLTGLSYEICVIITGVVIGVYLTLGGFKSVVTTDKIQAIGMVTLGFAIVLLYKPISITGLVTANVDQISHSIPVADFISLFAAGFFGILGAADVYQRIFAAKSQNAARKGIALSGVAFLLFGMLIIALGIKIYSQFPDADPNNAFFSFLSSSFSPILVMLVATFIVASIFSTADTELFLSSILISKLFFWKKKLTPLFGIMLMWGILTVSIVIALFASSLVDIYFVLIYAFMVIGPVMLARLFNRGNDTVACVCMMISSLVLTALITKGLLIGYYPLLILVPTSFVWFVKARKLRSSV